MDIKKEKKIIFLLFKQKRKLNNYYKKWVLLAPVK